MFAVLLGALAPAVSHAVSWASGGDARWVEVCTAAGIRIIAADAAGQETPADDGAGVGDKRCPYCGTHAGTFGLPPASVADLAIPAVRELVPALLPGPPHSLYPWPASHPRAPPAIS